MQALGERPSAACSVRPTLMVIDDDDELRGMLVSALNVHYDVLSYADARAAIEQLRAGALPDLILLDLRMPGMNGWEFRIEQKQEPRWASIPVIAISADTSPQAAAIDSQAYFSKPIALDVLLKSIGGLLHALEEERREARARALERLSSLGMMATGVAHEVNNPLLFLTGNLALAEEQCRELDKRLTGAEAHALSGIRQRLASANRGAERIADVVRGISEFATADTDEVVSVDVAHLIESTLQLVANEMRHVSRVERELPMLTITTNPGRLRQVFLNLIQRAVRGMRDLGGANHVLRVDVRADARDGVIISISDTGPGLPPQVLRRVFEPFSSVKTATVGMGLALAISRELVQSLGGTLEVDSQLSEGSTFRIILPSRMRNELAPSNPPHVAITPAPQSLRKRLLVIDDEPMICKLLETYLASDYDVVALTQPAVALMRLLGGERFDLIVCDMMMPGVTGMDLYERAVSNLPELGKRFIFMTGGAASEAARTFLTATRPPQLLKPFRRHELIEALEAQLSTKH